ncbi:hypothetical protein Tco_0450257 [Tanacetum coccineum]
MMSSPNHPTSDIEDAFSSNFSDYIQASLDYVLASPGNTYSSSSNNSFGLVLKASPTLSLFHDEPYMKVMQAYYAKESPIPPPTIMSPSSMLSPIMPPKRTSTSEAPAMTQAAIRKLVTYSVTAALEAQAATMANADNTNRNTREREAPVARIVFCRNYIEDTRMKFVLVDLTEEVSILYFPELGPEDGRRILPSNCEGNDLKTYVRRFQELATLCPTMVPDSENNGKFLHRADCSKY